MNETTLDEAIQLAAKELPDGWRIHLMVEKHGYGITLKFFDPDYDEYSDWNSDAGIVGEILEAIELAKSFG